jgi:methyl-accepting chemotaxis protein
MTTRWTVGAKLTAGFGLALLMLLVIGGVSYRSLILLNENAAAVTETHKVLEKLEGILSLLKDTETGQRGYVLTGLDRYLKPYTEAQEILEERLREVQDLTRKSARQQDRLKEMRPIIADRNEELKETIDKRKTDGVKDDKTAVDVQAAKGLQEALKVVVTDRGKKHMDSLRRIVGEMKAEEKQELDRRTQEEDDSVRTTKLTIVFGSLAAFVLLLVISVMLTRAITGPLQAVTDRAQKIAGGDLRQDKLPVGSRDEIGQLTDAFNGMLGSLQELTRQTNGVTASLYSAAAEIMASTQQQAASTKEQAATVQQVTTTMEEVSQSGAQISAKAKQVAAGAEATSAVSSSGLQAVQETTRIMGAIREQIEEVAENIVALSEKTQAVGEIIATVNDIAERSNLLALNAAIEAGAAGEQGNRFSVVANEMKNLADQAKESTVQVRTILGDIQKRINSSVMLTEEAVKRGETGKQQADITEQTIRQMAKTTLDSVQAFEQIIGAGNQQQIGFEQVTQGMKDIRQAAGQTAAATSQLDKAVVNLNQLSAELSRTVGRFKL